MEYFKLYMKSNNQIIIKSNISNYIFQYIYEWNISNYQLKE